VRIVFDQATAVAAGVGARLIAPVTAIVTRFRWVRLLHAEGQTYTADAFAEAADPRLRRLAERLSGAALVRLSAALWRGREWPDVLGLSLRFFGQPKARPEAPSRQDLFLASAPGIVGLPLGLLTTDPHDFLVNRYHGLAPFEVDGIGRLRLRAGWSQPAPPATSRFERLMAAVVEERAELALETRVRDDTEWRSLLRLRLRVPAMLDEHRCRFSPFNDRAGLRAAGLVHSLRRAPVTVAQKVRAAPTPTGDARGHENWRNAR
jgi:hypothetical protein